ncbi:cytochrome P450 [Streptomyces sp. NPDC096048]|uniref:cytochrome P450 n=1 Tax=Streptomyces sp. NPDC096048 TaxID=3366072 RepID=UPI003824CCC5
MAGVVQRREHRNRGDSEPPVLPGRFPVFGHLPRILRDPLSFWASLPKEDEITTVYIGKRPIYFLRSHRLVRSLLTGESRAFTRGLVFEKAAKIFGQGIIVSDGEQHGRNRRLIQPAFHHHKIEHYVDIMRSVVEERSSTWTAGQPFALSSETHETAVEVLTRTLFRADLAARAVEDVKRAFSGIVEGITAQALYPYPWMEKLPFPVNRRYERSAALFHDVVKAMIAEQRTSPLQDDSLLGTLINARDQDNALSEEQLRDETVTMLVAGAETVSTALAWLFHELGRCPQAEQRLVDELHTQLGDRPISYQDFRKLPYTAAAINEVMRLHHPNWFLSRRAVSPVSLGNRCIPAGGEVAFSLSTMHRDPEVFDHPLRFDPDRWLDGRTDDLPRSAYMPFGVGKHKCIGDAYAVAELMVSIACIIRRWTLAHQPGTRVREVPWTTVQPAGLVMVAQPRRNA